jgi:hypothetical protein
LFRPCPGAFSTSDGLSVAADTLSMLPDHAAAERAAAEALAVFDREEYASFGSIAATRAHLALARVRQADVDGAREALRPVLELPPRRRVHGVLSSLARVHEALGDPGYHGSPAARDTAAEIETFSQLPARTGLPG